MVADEEIIMRLTQVMGMLRWRKLYPQVTPLHIMIAFDYLHEAARTQIDAPRGSNAKVDGFRVSEKQTLNVAKHGSSYLSKVMG
jgi:hypothetical protein